MQSQLTNAANLKDKLEERLQIITEEAKFLKKKQEEYTEQMRVLFEKVKFKLQNQIDQLKRININIKFVVIFSQNLYLLTPKGSCVQILNN